MPRNLSIANKDEIMEGFWDPSPQASGSQPVAKQPDSDEYVEATAALLEAYNVGLRKKPCGEPTNVRQGGLTTF